MNYDEFKKALPTLVAHQDGNFYETDTVWLDDCDARAVVESCLDKQRVRDVILGLDFDECGWQLEHKKKLLEELGL